MVTGGDVVGNDWGDGFVEGDAQRASGPVADGDGVGTADDLDVQVLADGVDLRDGVSDLAAGAFVLAVGLLLALRQAAGEALDLQGAQAVAVNDGVGAPGPGEDVGVGALAAE